MSDPARKPTAVLGIGNLLYGDDGFGPRVAQALAGQRLGEGVDVIDAGAIGVDLLDYLTEYRRVIIIDAADMGLEPGTLRTFAPEEVRSLKKGSQLSLHSSDILGVIELGAALGAKLADITVIAVQPELLAPGDRLSETVEAAVAGAAARVKELIG